METFQPPGDVIKDDYTLKLMTVPSRVENPVGEPYPQPYDQVVGVEYGKGEVEWAQPGLNGVEQYSPSDVTANEIPSDPTHSERFLEYWKDHYATHPGGAITEGNCHHFATYIQHGVASAARPDGIVERGTVVEDRKLGLGEHAVVGAVIDGESGADHSISGLGGNDARALQRMGPHGPLGIVPIDVTLDRYRHTIPGLPSEVDLYALRDTTVIPAESDPDL